MLNVFKHITLFCSNRFRMIFDNMNENIAILTNQHHIRTIFDNINENMTIFNSTKFF